MIRRQPTIGLREGLRLRSWTPEDAPGLLLATRDEAVRHYAGRLIEDRAAALEMLRRWGGSWSEGSGAAWALSDAGGQVLGSLRFGIIDTNLLTGSVGYWLLPEVRGRGIASAALRAGTAEVFRHLGWHRIELYHAVENQRSCSVARRAGYRQEGVMREAMRYPSDGRWSDEHLHARLVSDPHFP
jgi:RimJ/RimL family protein N-acetyltransferase